MPLSDEVIEEIDIGTIGLSIESQAICNVLERKFSEIRSQLFSLKTKEDIE